MYVQNQAYCFFNLKYVDVYDHYAACCVPLKLSSIVHVSQFIKVSFYHESIVSFVSRHYMRGITEFNV